MDLIEGFAMDVEARDYRTLDDVLEYSYHVAGIVGVMMARVMGVRDDHVLDRACDLGLAFQLTNIARDVIDAKYWHDGYSPHPALTADPLCLGDLLGASRLLLPSTASNGRAKALVN